MNRSGYTDDGDDDPLALGRWRAQVASAIRGKRGQAFLREVLAIMDATPPEEQHLIAGELIDGDGCCCTIGLACKARGIDVSRVDVECPEDVGRAVGIAYQLAAEVEYENDSERIWDKSARDGRGAFREETTTERWQRMRGWVERQIQQKDATA